MSDSGLTLSILKGCLDRVEYLDPHQKWWRDAFVAWRNIYWRFLGIKAKIRYYDGIPIIKTNLMLDKERNE